MFSDGSHQSVGDEFLLRSWYACHHLYSEMLSTILNVWFIFVESAVRKLPRLYLGQVKISLRGYVSLSSHTLARCSPLDFRWPLATVQKFWNCFACGVQVSSFSKIIAHGDYPSVSYIVTNMMMKLRSPRTPLDSTSLLAQETDRKWSCGWRQFDRNLNAMWGFLSWKIHTVSVNHTVLCAKTLVVCVPLRSEISELCSRLTRRL